jgi:hypothetical protein
LREKEVLPCNRLLYLNTFYLNTIAIITAFQLGPARLARLTNQLCRFFYYSPNPLGNACRTRVSQISTLAPMRRLLFAMLGSDKDV